MGNWLTASTGSSSRYRSIQRRKSMQKLIAVLAILAAAASPALAKKNSDNLSDHPKAHASAVDGDTSNGANGKIIWGGRVVAQDPDPFIRMGITRGLGNWGGD
jgi:hypothetical protein